MMRFRPQSSSRALARLWQAGLAAATATACVSCANGRADVFEAPAPASTQPASSQPAADPDWPTVASVLHRPGQARGDVYVVTIPRDDLFVSVEGMSVPTEAGIESEFRFFRCTCGKMRVLGQFVVADYEANDVVDALRQGHFIVSSIGPFLLYEHPRLLQVRFQGEDKTEVLAKTLREALSWTGKERSQTQPSGE